MRYYTYDESGKILVCGSSPENMRDWYTENHPRVLFFGDDALFSDTAHYIHAGAIIAMPPQPSPHHIFNYATKQWEDPRTLADLKAAQWELIKQARSQAEYAGFTWDGSTFDSDALSQNRITGAVTLAQMSPTFVINWILADNTTRTLNQPT